MGVARGFTRTRNNFPLTIDVIRVQNLGDPITATPPALRARFEPLFGYLTQPVNGHTFPICIGETGSAFVKWPLPPPDNNPARPL